MAVSLVPVISSQLAAVGYDAAARELVIKFHGADREGPVYSYDGVPLELAAALLSTPSPGSFFHRHIRSGGYRYRRLEAAP